METDWRDYAGGRKYSAVPEHKGYGWLMSCASINMMQKLNFNRLHSEGFMFRNYMEGTKGITSGEYMAMNFCFDPNDAYIHSDENRLILRDGQLREYAW